MGGRKLLLGRRVEAAPADVLEADEGLDLCMWLCVGVVLSEALCESSLRRSSVVDAAEATPRRFCASPFGLDMMAVEERQPLLTKTKSETLQENLMQVDTIKAAVGYV